MGIFRGLIGLDGVVSFDTELRKRAWALSHVCLTLKTHIQRQFRAEP
jgi:hypothetical protein